MLGHKRIETTEKYYIFGTEKDKEQVTEMLEKNLNFAKLYDKEDNIVQKLVLVYNNFLEMRRIMKNYKKYIFDLDYTLLIPDWSKEDDYFKKNIPLEEQEDFFKQKQSILNKYELEFPKYDFKTLSDFFKSYGFSVSEEIINGWMIHNSKTIKDIVADGVVELFEYLKANNKDIVILTSWFSGTQIPRLKRTGLYEYIDKIVAGEDAMKPDLESFELAIGDTNKEDCIMIGDSVKSDKAGAENAGIDCYIVDKEHSIRDLLQMIINNKDNTIHRVKKK